MKQTYEQNNKNEIELVSKGEIPPAGSEVTLCQTHIHRGKKRFGTWVPRNVVKLFNIVDMEIMRKEKLLMESTVNICYSADVRTALVE